MRFDEIHYLDGSIGFNVIFLWKEAMVEVKYYSKGSLHFHAALILHNLGEDSGRQH